MHQAAFYSMPFFQMNKISSCIDFVSIFSKTFCYSIRTPAWWRVTSHGRCDTRAEEQHKKVDVCKSSKCTELDVDCRAESVVKTHNIHRSTSMYRVTVNSSIITGKCRPASKIACYLLKRSLYKLVRGGDHGYSSATYPMLLLYTQSVDTNRSVIIAKNYS